MPNAQFLDAEVSHHLVWALRVTAASFTRGVTRHRLAVAPYNVFALCQLKERRTWPSSAMARLPLEVLALIEAFLHDEARREAGDGVRAHTWGQHGRRTPKRSAGIDPVDSDATNDDDSRARICRAAAHQMNWEELRSIVPLDPSLRLSVRIGLLRPHVHIG